jgi:tetratricopeptide (TPR) repeat protein
MNVEFITDKMEESKNKLNILILDACRNNPLPSGTKSGGKGLNTSPVEGVYIAFAARDGQTAADGSLNGYSLYTEKLLQNIETPNQRLEDLFIKTRKAVKDETQNRQFPIDYGSVDGVFYFNFDSTLPFSNSPTNISSDRIKEAREFFILGLNCSSTDYDCKISNYTKAINLNPNDAEAYYWRGCTYRDKQNHDQAIQDYTKAIQLNPNYQDAYFWRGRSYYQKQNYQKAVSDLTIYVELAPNSRSGYLTRALSYEILGEKAKAEADRKKAKELEGKP